MKVDMNRGNIASYEKGSAEPSIEKLQRIVEYFKTDINAFIHNNLEEATATAGLKDFNYRSTSEHTYLGNDGVDQDPEFFQIMKKYSEINEYKLTNYKRMDQSLNQIQQELNELKQVMKDILKVNSQILAQQHTIK